MFCYPRDWGTINCISQTQDLTFWTKNYSSSNRISQNILSLSSPILLLTLSDKYKLLCTSLMILFTSWNWTIIQCKWSPNPHLQAYPSLHTLLSTDISCQNQPACSEWLCSSSRKKRTLCLLHIYIYMKFYIYIYNYRKFCVYMNLQNLP